MTSSGSSGSSSGGGGGAAATPSLTAINGEERLTVAVRVRPMESSGSADQKCVQVISKKSLLFDDSTNKMKPRKYIYDHVFDEKTSQSEVYKLTTAPLVKDVLNGLNAAAFAYGATGSGKTHTMLGPNPKKAATPLSDTNQFHSLNPNDGLMLRAIWEIFEFVETSEQPDTFKISVSYLEVYNELIRDLLQPGGPLELREDNRGSKITVAGLSEVTTSSRQEVIALLLKGNKARTMEPTAANQTSSRSHALLSVTVTHASALGTKQGRLFLTDLAGSERAKKTKNKGKRLQEGAHINRSLLALGNCINALSGGARYVNYRDSKLTRLLKEALSGRCRTVMIAHVSPEMRHHDESKNTLVYADRANNITTRMQNPDAIMEETREFPTVHYQNLVTELREEVNRLKSKMLTERPRSGAALHINPKNEERKAELRYLREQIVLTFKQQMKLRRRLLEAESHLLGLELDAERQHMVISHWQGRIGKLYSSKGGENPETDSEGRTALRSAWNELAAIEKESKRYKEIVAGTERDLEECRQKGVALEDELPERISSDEERELLGLLCRVHELEADKVSLQAERLARQGELRRRDLQLLRAERQRRLCEDIISTQRKIIEDEKLELPLELRELYSLYQQEIHASIYSNNGSGLGYSDVHDLDKLPPIYLKHTPSSSSSGSEWAASPLTERAAEDEEDPDDIMGPPVGPKLPLISAKSRLLRSSKQSTSSEE